MHSQSPNAFEASKHVSPPGKRFYNALVAPLTAALILVSMSIPAQAALQTSGRDIVNEQGQVVRFESLSWFGLESANFAPHGLWSRGYKSMMDQVKSLGFNSLRIPFSSEMVLSSTATPNSIDYSQNPDLVGLTPIQVLDQIVAYADQIGLKLILDHHRSSAGAGTESELWYTSQYSESSLIQVWQFVAERYKGHPSVIGADLHNECHGAATWGDGNLATDWRAAAERVGNAILAVNSDLLIVVEGIEIYGGLSYWWGGNLAGALLYPVILNVPNKLVYSPHDYPDSIFPQTWFSDPSYPANLPAKFRSMWGQIAEQNVAPIWVGEFGTKLVDPKDLPWFKSIISYMNGDFNGSGVSQLPASSLGLSFSFWALNPDSGDTGGLLEDDWKTVDPTKYQYLKALLTGGLISNSVLPSSSTNPSPTPAPTPAPTATPIPAPSTSTQAIGIHLGYQNNQISLMTNQSRFVLKLANSSNSSLAMGNVKIRYYFNDSNPQAAYCDYALMGCSHIQATFNSNYVEFSFDSSSPILTAGGDSGEIQLRLAHKDWSTFDQSLNPSFVQNQTSLIDNSNMTVLVSGVLVFGQAPGSAPAPVSATPTPSPVPTPVPTPVVATPSPSPTPSSKTPSTGASCSVQFSLQNAWGTGYVAQVAATNNGAQTINGFTLVLSFASSPTIVNIWNASATATTSGLNIQGVSYNRTLASGQSAAFGYQAAIGASGGTTSAAMLPSTATLNGTVCTLTAK